MERGHDHNLLGRILLYLTYWFRRREQAQAIALFMTAIPITNVLGVRFPA
jgi:hypothetical protein